MTDQTPEEVNAEFFQEDLVDDVELTAHTGVDESEESICLSKENEVEEVDSHKIKGSSGRRINIDVGQVSDEDSDEEEEYTSDECEDDDEDGAELDISLGSVYASSSYGKRLESVYASSSYGSRYDRVRSHLQFFWQVHLRPETEDVVSLQEGGGSFYDGTLREAHFTRPIHRFNDFPLDIQEFLYQMFMEKVLKRPPTFMEVFDKTHKKNGTDQYISDRAREVASYSQHMIEKYVGEEEEPQLDLEVWFAASGTPKKGHVYGFGHSMDMIKVFSSTSSSSSQATGAFTTPGAPSTSSSEMMGFIRDEISGLESRLVHTMHT
ncbi:hypothetical protein Taro_041606 [Colocasia esculenta]|uniref:Uncharacterized protein n=1 Tax=Colocasia esculenta TaxID=4460 RepID=A0A843WGA6_COLES|nr:hypothetical protein [Colocasia esculenta]